MAAAGAAIRLRDGSSMPIPGFGTWRCDEAKLEEAVYHALKIGYRHIDCAQLYKNEHIVGRCELAGCSVATRALVSLPPTPHVARASPSSGPSVALSRTAPSPRAPTSG